MKPKNHEGLKYNNLTVLQEVEPIVRHYDDRSRTERRVLARCDCGTVLEVRLQAILGGATKACGCKNKTKVTEGDTFGDLVILEELPSLKKKRRFLVQCSCGKKKDIALASLLSGKSKTCGCGVTKATTQRNTVHGYAHRKKKTPEYKAWERMKSRCLNPSNINYVDYGGRGISVCQEWIESFESFLQHLGPRPTKNHSLDRINNEGNYQPGNVRWATRKQQARNRRSCHLVTIGNETKTIVEWSEMPGARSQTQISSRLKAKLPAELAVFKPQK